jgi:putative transposase
MSTQTKVDMYKNDLSARRYSDAFKLKILDEFSKGKYSKRDLSRLYGIRASTINDWIKKFDRKDLMNTRIIVENADEISRLKLLQKEIEQLKKLLLRKDMELLANDAYLEAIAEKLGFKNVAALKKKFKHKALMKAVIKAKKIGVASVAEICSFFGLKRDAYYKYQKRLIRRASVVSQVVDLVKKERQGQPRVGTRKLLEALRPTFKNASIKVGRDCLFDILRQYNMLISRKKASCRTTNSYHHFHKYNNLVKDIKVTVPNQVWVSDITYIRTVKGFCYLALITDMYSRKIIGYDISDSLELAGCLKALKMALRHVRNPSGLVHHSDRGIQYCSNLYVNELKKRNIKISMTEENHCYENAIAERVNGILKDEFYLDQCFFSTRHACMAAKNAVDIYNSKRLHLSLDYKTPNMVFKIVA